MRVVEAAVPRFAHAGHEEDLVVHRQPKQQREEEDRDPALDLVEAVQAERVGAEPPAEEDDEHAVARRYREQVEDDRLQREQQRAERAQQERIGEREHGQHEQRERAVGALQEVDPLSGAASREHLRGARETRVRDDRRAQPRGEPLCGFPAVLVPADDDEFLVASGRLDQPLQVGDLRVFP